MEMQRFLVLPKLPWMNLSPDARLTPFIAVFEAQRPFGTPGVLRDPTTLNAPQDSERIWITTMASGSSHSGCRAGHLAGRHIIEDLKVEGCHRLSLPASGRGPSRRRGFLEKAIADESESRAAFFQRLR
jgi:hypothetical protein